MIRDYPKREIIAEIDNDVALPMENNDNHRDQNNIVENEEKAEVYDPTQGNDNDGSQYNDISPDRHQRQHSDDSHDDFNVDLMEPYDNSYDQNSGITRSLSDHVQTVQFFLSFVFFLYTLFCA